MCGIAGIILKQKNPSFAFWKIVILAILGTRRVLIERTIGWVDPAEYSISFNFISVNTYGLTVKAVFKEEKNPLFR